MYLLYYYYYNSTYTAMTESAHTILYYIILYTHCTCLLCIIYVLPLRQYNYNVICTGRLT